GSRLFLPPYMKPVEPNVPKQIVEGYTELGNYLAREMRAQGFKGITTDSTYDAWSPSRAYSHYHGGVRILSETASARIASPITVKFDELTSREGYDPKKETPNFGPLWQGGEWHLSDITKYMTTGAFLLLQHAAEHREEWLQRFYAIGKQAVTPSLHPGPRAFILPYSSNQQRLISILQRAGVEVDSASPFTYKRQRFPIFSAVVRLDQPYGMFAKALLEAQHYPDLRDQSGHPIAPYDVTAHSLAMLLGVQTIAVNDLPIYRPVKRGGVIVGGSGKQEFGMALYRSSVPTNDEGWTRWLLQDLDVGFESIDDRDIRKSGLFPHFFSVSIPDQPARTIFGGYRTLTMPPELTGGLGQEGVKALREFVEAGGTLVCLNRASDFAIEQFKLPLRNVVAGLPRTEFYVPGSILRLELDTTNPIAKGMPKESIAWAEDSPVFEVVQGSSTIPTSNVHIVGWYPRDKDPLLSGWLLGGNRIKGKAALVEVMLGKGRIILFGFRPQYRAQSLATYPLFFNALNAK
ncbi:MAG TPA: hypothetical protein VKB46_12925, partial [Pyrinomonadaceae bacterium]|nr:hypothetical protein [Pyrinomonadaceae bacterium]